MGTPDSLAPTVVVIDDEPLIRWSVSQGLREAGYQTRTAGTAAEALALIENLAHQPLVVLLDLRLPDTSDLSLFHAIRTSRPHAPVIVITESATEDTASRARLDGAYAVIGKPFDLRAVISLVDHAWQTVVH